MPDRMALDRYGLTRYALPRYGTPYVTTTVRILGEDQISTFEAMCELAGRRPHELAADIVLRVPVAIAENPTDMGLTCGDPGCSQVRLVCSRRLSSARRGR